MDRYQAFYQNFDFTASSVKILLLSMNQPMVPARLCEENELQRAATHLGEVLFDSI